MGIGRGDGTCRIQFRHLFLCQVPADRVEVLAKLLLVARTDDDG